MHVEKLGKISFHNHSYQSAIDILAMISFQAPLKPLVITVSRKGPHNYNFIFSYCLYQVKKINQFGDHM